MSSVCERYKHVLIMNRMTQSSDTDARPAQSHRPMHMATCAQVATSMLYLSCAEQCSAVQDSKLRMQPAEPLLS
jgi:hypothetical protein